MNVISSCMSWSKSLAVQGPEFISTLWGRRRSPKDSSGCIYSLHQYTAIFLISFLLKLSKKRGGVFTYCFSFTFNSQIVLSRFLFLKNNQLHPSYPVYCPLFTSFSKHLLINNVCDYLLKTFYSLFELYILLSYFTDSFFTDIVKFCFKETELGKLPFKHV